MEKVKIWLLGTPRAELGGVPVEGLDNQRLPWLLALLLLPEPNQPVSRTDLMHWLYPEDASDKERSLKELLRYARKTFKDRIPNAGTGMIWFPVFDLPDADFVDVYSLQRTSDNNEVVGLYGGPLLKGIETDSNKLAESERARSVIDWCGGRSLYEDIYAQAVISIARDACASGDNLKVKKARIILESSATFLEPDSKNNKPLSEVAANLSKLDRLKIESALSDFVPLERAATTESKNYQASELRVIPRTPTPFVAHEYTLLQGRSLVGRVEDTEKLQAWIDEPAGDPVFSVVGIGGAGKSALIWSWFCQSLAPLAEEKSWPMIWWSFYDVDETFESFVAHALSYLTATPLDIVEKLSKQDQQNGLISALQQRRTFVVLDGAERLLMAYSRLATAQMLDAAIDAHSYYPEERNYRQASDPRVRRFLRQLTSLKKSRVLITTRLECSDLQDNMSVPISGSAVWEIPPLKPLDALALWQSMGAKGETSQLLEMFEILGYHALLIQTLASEVASWAEAPGDFASWRRAYPGFDYLYQTPEKLQQHILFYATRGLSDVARTVLRLITAFRMAVQHDFLSAAFDRLSQNEANSKILSSAVSELFNRGLIGWERTARRYDMHPLVRAVTWSECPLDDRSTIYAAIRLSLRADELGNGDYFWPRINKLEDLAKPIELYNALIGEQKYDAAYTCYLEWLHTALKFRVKLPRLQAQLLQQLFSSQAIPVPMLTSESANIDLRYDYASALLSSGQPSRICDLFGENRQSFVCIKALLSIGSLYEAEFMIRSSYLTSVSLGRDAAEIALSLSYFGLVLYLTGRDAGEIFQRSFELVHRLDSAIVGATEFEICNHYGSALLVTGAYNQARTVAAEGISALREHNIQVVVPGLTTEESFERVADYTVADCIIGVAYLGEQRLDMAESKLDEALADARKGSLIHEELVALVASAKLNFMRGKIEVAREFLNEAWEPILRGHYRLIHADALLLLSRIELSVGNLEAAKDSVAQAYRLAWCDGPPYSYAAGLRQASEILEQLGIEPLADWQQSIIADRSPMPPVQVCESEGSPIVFANACCLTQHV